MISAIQIKNFKGILDSGVVPLDRFHVLVGPNGSGKSTFLEALDLVRSCLLVGQTRAVEERVPDHRDLTFKQLGGQIQVDLWLDATLHYHLAIAARDDSGVGVTEELLEQQSVSGQWRSLIWHSAPKRHAYQRELSDKVDEFRFGDDRPALAFVPPDVELFPTANAVRSLLLDGIRYVQLDSPGMRRPAAATRSTELELDGTNLPRAVGKLIRTRDESVQRWVDHLRYAIDDLESIGWGTRQPDNAEYILLRYTGGLECPSWLLSDGTLRMLAMTLPAFLPPSPRVYMFEEPENGVHPKALEVILQSLRAIPDSQVFVATHSPLVIQAAGVEPLLCFTRDENGVHVHRGTNHPALKDWQGVPDLGSVFASRILG